MIRLRTGNLSTSTLKAVWHERTPPDPEVDRARLVAWKAAGFDEVEDYLAWGVVEPEPGRWDFSLHRANLDAAEAAGLSTWIYPWLHVSPHWWTHGQAVDDDASFIAARCAATDRAGYFPSLFAESTWTRFARFYEAVHEALGTHIEGVALAWPSDYGEVGAASNISRWLFPHRPDGPAHGDALWYGDGPARRALVEWLEREHGSLSATADRWDVGATTLTGKRFPVLSTASSEALRVDVARFIRSSTRAHLERLVLLARDTFGSLPLEVKVGHASEAIQLGRTMGDVVSVAARHDVAVRSTHSGQAPLFTKHIAALCREHGARFTSEGPRDVGYDVLARRLHDDVSHGSTHLYEFPEQLEALDLESLRDALGHAPCARAVAAFMPTLDLALNPGLGLPECLTVGLDTLRRLVDFDLVSDVERLDDATSALLLLDACDVAASTYNEIARWVDAGGTLIVGTPGAPRVCEAAGSVELDARGGALRDAITRNDKASCDINANDLDHASNSAAPEGIARTYAQPGEDVDRLLVGAGWHGREDGHFAWPERSAPVPTRWTTGRARLRLPKVTGPCEARGVVVIDATIRGQAPHTPVAVWWNDVAIGRIDFPREPGPVWLDAPPPRADAPNLVTLVMPTTRPPEINGAHDPRELGILVRDVRWIGLETPADDVGGLAAIPGLTVRERPRDREPEASPYPSLAFGHGTIFPGDTTPASALDALRTWLASESATRSAVIARDIDEACIVTPLDNGLLLHNPSREPATPRVVIHAHDVEGVPQGTLPPLETIPGRSTRFVPWDRLA